MLFDQISLLVAIGFSSAALGLTLLTAWLTARSDRFLLSWAAGMGSAVVGVVLFAALGTQYQPVVQVASFAFLILCFSLVYAGAMQFRVGQANWPAAIAVAGVGLLSTAVAFAFGYSGLGTIFANFTMAALIGLTAHQYWLGRAEAPVPMIANALLYALNAGAFLLCGIVLLLQGELVLSERPSNWAEDLNAIALIVGITGIGAFSLMLNQSRISRRHRKEAMTDALTGLLNRRAIFEMYSKDLVAPGTAAIVLDLDNFKSINDRYGHDTGDAVICHFADVLRQCVRQTDTVARLGGEEFCVVLPNTTAGKAADIAERIRATLESQRIDTRHCIVQATVSAGITVCTGTPESFETLMRHADDALYAAKRNGRNQVSGTGRRVAA